MYSQKNSLPFLGFLNIQTDVKGFSITMTIRNLETQRLTWKIDEDLSLRNQWRLRCLLATKAWGIRKARDCTLDAQDFILVSGFLHFRLHILTEFTIMPPIFQLFLFQALALKDERVKTCLTNIFETVLYSLK